MTTRFSAKLLFQYRVDLGRASGKRRTCEERIVVFSAASPAKAVAAAKKQGKASEFSYRNDENNPVHIEFVGVLDILPHGPEMEEGVVWYDIRDRLLPKERRGTLVLTDKELLHRAAR
jgi:hypothetical protein